ncbi:MAG: radical SAM protein [Myxococcales bacterium]|nr:radical SAM protein [Myxococcales bacterium]
MSASLPLVVDRREGQPALRVTEIFHSIQGEATFAGWPCTFIRLTGCNLRCRWCDTEYSFHGGTTMTVSDVLREIARHPARRVEITGGEPLLQKATPLLARSLLDAGHEVWCETSGERNIDLLPEGVRRVMDLKAPGSGEHERNDLENLARLRPGDEVKIVCADRQDFDWAVEMMHQHSSLKRVPVHVSPVYGELEPSDLADWILASGLEIRLNLQLHKVLWGDQRGR